MATVTDGNDLRATRVLVGLALAGMLALAGTFALAGCSSSSGPNASPGSASTNGSAVAGTAQTAITYLDQARQLIVDLATAVVPGAKVKQTVSDGPPGKCKSPLAGDVYFSIARDFQAPTDRTGSSVLPAISSELKSRGFTTSATESGGAFDTVHATKDDAVGVAAMGSPTSGLVRIGVDTQCGRPTAADDNVGVETSAP